MTTSTPRPLPVRVRDVEPSTLLMDTLRGEGLAPYVPRAVDRDLDRVLMAPGIVVIRHETASGARRTAYEALLRNLPEATLLNGWDALLSSDVDLDPDIVMWLDGNWFARDDLLDSLSRLVAWVQDAPDRWVIGLVSQTRVNDEDWQRILDELRPRVVTISAQLTMEEQEWAKAQFTTATSMTTAADLASAGNPVPRSAEATRDEPRGPHVADYRADTDRGTDRLNISTDVNMLADLVTSRLVQPPLSIGLFGNWGAGKSFFMREMRERVTVLADAARAAERQSGAHGREVSSYCSSVRQITFNAWHYTETNLWASLATHIFDNLAASGSDIDLQRRAAELAAQRDTEQSLLAQLSTVRLERMLVSAQQERQVAKGRAVRAGIAALHELSNSDRSLIATELGVTQPTIEDVQRFAHDVRGLRADLRNMLHWLHSDPITAIVFACGLGVVATLVLALGRTGWPGLAGVATVLATIGTATARAKAAISRIRDAAALGTGFGTRAVSLQGRVDELDQEAERLERAIAELAPHKDVTAYATARTSDSTYRDDYQQHLGLVSMLRRDLETFAALLAGERDRSTTSAGVERIVLYVDDLDRCPPPVVIKVLEAIHLLLALPVFVVVVGVDARWLIRSICQHYTSLLDADITYPANVAFAKQYLEKIFQVPFLLPPMGSDGFAELINGLTEAHATDDEIEPESLYLADHSIATRLANDGGAPTRPGTTAPRAQPTTQIPTTIRDTKPDTASPDVQLRPARLAISGIERRYLATLGPLVLSPRGAKRLVNLYRLLRARLSVTDLSELLATNAYQAVLTLLAVLVGHPDEASRLFDTIRKTSPDAPWSATLEGLDSTSPLRTILTDLADSTTPTVGAYQQWLPLVSRFSFGSP